MDNLQLDVPSFFICPISLQIMKEPVTISTGMTFDRDSIQKWIFSYNHITCPITKQPLSDFTLIPNSNLLRLIQSWQLHNLSLRKSIEQQQQEQQQQQQEPNHDALVSLRVFLEEIKQPHLQVNSLRKIKTLLYNRIFFTGDDALYSSVASLIIVKSESNIDHSSILIDEALSVLCLLNPSDETLKIVSQNGNGLLIDSLCTIMTNYLSNQARSQTAVILKSIFKVVDGIYKEGLKSEFFESITEILKDQNSENGSIAVLNIALEVFPFGKNKEKAIQVGLVSVLVELLAENNQKRPCEMILFALEKLCSKAEGRAAFLAHPISLPAVLSKILRVSHVGNYKAISLLLWIFRFCKSNKIAQDFMEVGGVAKVFMLLQTGCDSKTQDKVSEILGFHKETWSKSPCFPSSVRD